MNNHLIVYAKRPIAGYTKTRLAAGIGAEGAAGVYARMLYSLLFDIQAHQTKSLQLTLSLASTEDIPFFHAAFPEWTVTHQVKGDLGFRMTTSMKQEFQNGASKVVLVGSDIPYLSHSHIQQAFDGLDHSDIVFGPTNDGGFYLAGTTIPTLDIFRDIEWSTPSVLNKCQQNAFKQGHSVKLITKLYDMDTEKEYFDWQQRLLDRTQAKE